jgi:hypothetical protein
MPLLTSAYKRVTAWLGIGAGLVVLLAATLDAVAPTTAGEYHLKAVFLFNFAKFVEWPPQAFGDAHDPFIICSAGPNPFGSFLDDEVRGQTVRGRPISNLGFFNPRDARTCQILFFPASEHKRERGILDSLQGASVLTVGEADGFTANGGIVQFKQIDARIYIEIVPEAAERASLRISARLLSLASLVRHPL